ncbi:ATP-binding domain-containing protein, partial [Actinomadura sp. BRA 177]|uniref:ATP-binding domain-containing protein n=1 Tax=Actinomadura sp. BRA 177 TaxID=2745202 RepID=UPI0020CC4350
FTGWPPDEIVRILSVGSVRCVQETATTQTSLFDAPTAASEVAWSEGDRGRLGEGLPERVQVLDVLEAKGLEFDAAVIVAPETVAAQSPRGLRVLYVAVSRATQRLTVLTADPEWRDILLSD